MGNRDKRESSCPACAAHLKAGVFGTLCLGGCRKRLKTALFGPTLQDATAASRCQVRRPGFAILFLPAVCTYGKLCRLGRAGGGVGRFDAASAERRLGATLCFGRAVRPVIGNAHFVWASSPAAGILPWCPPPELAGVFCLVALVLLRILVVWRPFLVHRSFNAAGQRSLSGGFFSCRLSAHRARQRLISSASLPWPCAVRRARAAGPLRGPLARHRGSLCGCHPGTAAVIAAIVRDRRAFGEFCLSLLGSSIPHGVPSVGTSTRVAPRLVTSSASVTSTVASKPVEPRSKTACRSVTRFLPLAAAVGRCAH